MRVMKMQRFYVDAPLPIDYVEKEPSGREAKELILLLHGYLQNGQTLIRSLGDACLEEARVLAPNGPFPIPRKTEGGFKVGYSWYFYDPVQDEYLVDMRTSIKFLCSAVEALGFMNMPKRIIGFSQGGYLAPFVGHAMKNVKQVIGIGSSYLVDELPGPLPFRWDGIHGGQDEVVGCEGARRAHSKLASMGIAGDFHVLNEIGHELNEEVATKLKAVLSY
jgi:predicted esterase